MNNWYIKLANQSEDFLKNRNWKNYKKFAPILVLEFNSKTKNLIKNTDIINDEGKVNTLEGPQKIKEGDIICKGVDGEYWVQPKSRLKDKYDLNKNYNSRGKTPWEEWVPKGEKVKAIQIDDKESFNIGSMKGKKNDWVLCDPENLSDKWIIDNNLFKKTYKIIHKD